MLIKEQIKALLAAVGAIAFTAIIVWAYSSGKAAGTSETQELWNKEKTAYALAIDVARKKLEAEQQAHAATSTSIDKRLLELERDGDAELRRLNRDYTDRMRNSEARAAEYQRQAQGTPDQCSRLASHAAELDRSLEQGRLLVGELQTVIGQRDAQLKLLGEQIITDRELINEN